MTTTWLIRSPVSLSAESICACFTSTSRQASCNYGIGKDGRVYATNSPYFIRDFRKMVELFTQMNKPLDRVAVVRSVSGKTGRDFITCSVVR